MNPNTLNITAIGVLSGQIQMTVQRLRAVADELGIEPSAYINGIPHFDSTDAERIATHVRTLGRADGVTGDRARNLN